MSRSSERQGVVQASANDSQKKKRDFQFSEYWENRFWMKHWDKPCESERDPAAATSGPRPRETRASSNEPMGESEGERLIEGDGGEQLRAFDNGGREAGVCERRLGTKISSGMKPPKWLLRGGRQWLPLLHEMNQKNLEKKIRE
ncbi:hypothetical protein TorRG33x02_086200 [Trema orientale]|uniref:Uncharacterized protein n=1 Tax=Trema orientale TaxID=63057 RepID=A0A2P5FCG0_TREOI|nr:hypothetical protein TorRG33x02_086200 [Trema orientale]